ncbi:PAS domain S-box-containing protein [Desulfotomaculum arcticum]|uniref:histidine kinase n=1 Tax=Desulfotruncus arcticus DSM 17038 TaxID=1121424 RepID=A0A1I2ULI9_9FIRM|nr:PAS domain-containing sensor histidine kinase [Desulfotruncus arcticus]SFG75641.1 PAS domain S-box-containing protein [Desulfotomaculum arcticum] [Desulfotruncus arcticus DSM 17038]
MNDEEKTKDQLIKELVELRSRVAELQTVQTPRKQTEEKLERTLREQYHFLQRLIDTIPNPIFYKNVHGLFTGCNAAYEAYVGLAKEDIIGKSVFEVYPDDLAEIYHEKDTALFTEPGVQVFETKFRVADGTRRDMVFNKATYESSVGTLAGLVGVITDITDRKRAEEALKEERQRLFSLLDSLPALVYLQAQDYSISFSNRYFWEVFGKPKKRPCYEILHGRKQPCSECSTFRVFDTKTPQVLEEDMLAGRYYRIYLYPFSDIDGSPQILVLGIDINDQKQAEEAMRLSQELFFKAFNASPSMMAIARLADNKIINANDSFLNAAGYRREEIVGLTACDLNLWESTKTRVKIVEMLHQGKPVRNFECKFRAKSGKGRVGLVSAELIEFGGEPCLLAAVNDITERKQLEQEMARLDRLNLVGEMAAAIGHEVRNPMTTVRGFLQLLGEKAGCMLYKDYFNLMIDELDRANSIITQFLSLAKDKPVDKNEQNLNTIINTIFPLIQADVYKSDKYVNLELNDIPDLFLDDNEIRQLILNLVRNGLEAMQSDGILTIRTYADADKVVLAVQDQGCGIEAGVVDKLGTPFFTTKDNGTGLGLAVCYSIADRHNSKIVIETAPTGTTFYVQFPCSGEIATLSSQ